MEFVAADYCIDLGTRKLAVSHHEKGLIHVGPSAIAIGGGDAPACRSTGTEALRKASLQSTKVDAEWPVDRGRVVNTGLCAEMVRGVLERARVGVLKGINRVAVGVTCGRTQLEGRAVVHALLGAGARRVDCVPSILAAAYGMGLDLTGTAGVLIADIGAGHTDVAVLAYDEVVREVSIPFGGVDMYHHVARVVAREYGIMVPVNTLDGHKAAIFGRVHRIPMSGMDLATGLPREVEVDGSLLASSMEQCTGVIRDTVSRVLGEAGPELASDIAGTGILLTGGFSTLPGLREGISDCLRFPVLSGENPELCVINGLMRLTGRGAHGLGFDRLLRGRAGRAI